MGYCVVELFWVWLLVCIEQRLMIIKYNIARDGSLCRTLQNIKTTSIYFYLFFYFPITGPESLYKTFCNENISSNPFKALLHISNFISCLDQILFRNNFLQICFLEKIASSNIWNRYNSNSGSESYFHLCIDFLHWQNHHLDLRAMALLSHISWSQSLCVHWTISILKCGSPRATSALQCIDTETHRNKNIF